MVLLREPPLYMLCKDAVGWLSTDSNQRQEVEVARGSFLSRMDNCYNFDPVKPVSVTMFVLDSQGVVKVTVLLKDMVALTMDEFHLLCTLNCKETRLKLATSPRSTSPLTRKVGDYVTFSPAGHMPVLAVVKYVGPVPELVRSGHLVGLQVVESGWEGGNTDGSVGGSSYFSAERKKGVFCDIGSVVVGGSCLIENADRSRNEAPSWASLFDNNRWVDDKEAVALGNARRPKLWARPRKQAAAGPTEVLQPSSLVRSSVAATSKPGADGEMSNEAVPKKATIQEEKEALKKRLAEIEVIELNELERLMLKKRENLEETKTCYKAKLEAASAALKSLQAEEAMKCSELVKDIDDLAAKIANKKKGIQPDESIRSCLECPICLEICKPPTQVWQCPEGHILCGSCSAKPEVLICPQCRVELAGRLSRNRVLEEMARKMLSHN